MPYKFQSHHTTCKIYLNFVDKMPKNCTKSMKISFITVSAFDY